MEKTLQKQRSLHPSLQTKLQLLQQIKKGNFERVAELANALSKVGRTNPQLYGKLSQFVCQNKKQLNQTDSQGDGQPDVIDIEDDFVQGKQWQTDEQIDYQQSQSDQQMQNNVKPQKNQKSALKRIFKEHVNNPPKKSLSNKKNVSTTNLTKSASSINLTKNASSINLTKNFSSTNLTKNFSSTNLTKNVPSTNLTKNFPSINLTKNSSSINLTYQFKKPFLSQTKTDVQTNLKPQLHKNSAISRTTKNLRSHF